MAAIGDLNRDGVPDLAIGACGDNTGGSPRGAVYVAFMHADGTISSTVKLANSTNGGPALADRRQLRRSVAAIGDLNRDGVPDLAIGAYGDDTGGSSRGAVYVAFMQADGTISSTVKLASGTNGGPALADGDFFGSAVAALGDLDRDGVPDLAIGAFGDSTGGPSAARSMWPSCRPMGPSAARSSWLISANGGPALAEFGLLRRLGGGIGDLDRDGALDLAIGANGDNTAAPTAARPMSCRSAPRPTCACSRPPRQPWSRSGQPFTYTLAFSNAAGLSASNLSLTDTLPVSVTVTGVFSSGVALTQTSGAPTFAWAIQPLAVGQGGVITLTGAVSGPGVITNTAPSPAPTRATRPPTIWPASAFWGKSPSPACRPSTPAPPPSAWRPP